mmetsp:Transcript_4319/g.6408  ORF Transcript_4319/g.6408 Transcript_4319/m.6408 type:complete len:564 (+) Transcript_4319:128-1819(+)|eukprot:CAMPEP_0202457620 /NCGR_PEP_ID=MMETSP1360-20130828/14598_1 /ASSEMBLY_ACC=CAM_ASM_000848 /TAXON_ID=515479 /ORGANISM="Licmophora paradoxa, Strain CCMP2313" /LENGTH=563 /DNA_ID=CAMNT_0049077765 /DNA_START=106 /DNA_END=1797 /DNA_ORIENTATION=-
MDEDEEHEESSPMQLPDEKMVLNEANPPLVAATLVPSEQIAIVEDALPASEAPLAVCTSLQREYTRGTSTSSTSSLQQEFSVHSVENSARLESDYHQPPPGPIPYGVADVHIGDEEALDTAETENNATPNQTGKDHQRQQIVTRCSRIYFVIATITFLIGFAGIIAVGITLTSKPPLKSQLPLPTLPVHSHDIPTSAPSSESPSLAPSCSGLFSSIFSLAVPQGGSTFFTMDRHGNTIVVTNYNYQTGASGLQFFDLVNDDQFETEAAYHIHDLRISGDGNTLVCGVNGFEGNAHGGAALFFEKINNQWLSPVHIEAGSGRKGAVNSVSISYDGSVVAYVSSDGVIDVVRKGNSTKLMQEYGNRLNQTYFDSNTKVNLSGDGTRLFVSANKMVRAYELNNVTRTWELLGPSIHYDYPTNVAVSHTGSVVVVGSTLDFPAVAYEEWQDDETNEKTWEKVGTFDILSGGFSQRLALSSDGRNVVLVETIENQKNVATLFRKSGTAFIAAQHMTLRDGPLRGVALDPVGEQLTVAIHDSVVAYRKDCGTRGLFQRPSDRNRHLGGQ